MVKCEYKTGKKTIYCLGSFRKKVTLLTRALTNTSNMLEPTITETTLANVRANVENLPVQSGSQVYIDANTSITATHKFVIKYIDSVDTITGIELNSKKFRILRINNIEEQNKYLEFLCVERGKEDVQSNII